MYICSKIIFVSKIMQNVRRKLHLMLSLMQSLNCTCRFLGFLKGTSKYFYVIKHLFPKIHYFHENTANRIPCGPSIMDYPETSGNLRKPAAAVFSRFPEVFINEKFRNLPETSPAGFQRFP